MKNNKYNDDFFIKTQQKHGLNMLLCKFFFNWFNHLSKDKQKEFLKVYDPLNKTNSLSENIFLFEQFIELLPE